MTAETRFLVLTRFRPSNPSGGSPLRNWQNIQALARFGPVDVVSIGLEESSDTDEGVCRWTGFSQQKLLTRRSIWRRCKSMLWRIQPGLHPQQDTYAHAEVMDWLKRRLQKRSYALSVIEELHLVRYAPILKAHGCKVIFDAHNVEGLLRSDISASGGAKKASWPVRLREALLRKRLFQEEQTIARSADGVWVCSQTDADAFKALYGNLRRVAVVPNGVDVEAYRPASVSSGSSAERAERPLTLLYPGTFSYVPNEDAALRLITEVGPVLRDMGYSPRIILAGKNPTAAMRNAARAEPGVEITGAVESMLPYLMSACIIALPIRLGSGTRLKILEAFAAGCPVVSTSKGSEGISAMDNEHLLIRESATEIAEAAVKLWQSKEDRDRITANALALVRSQYSWATAATAIEQSISGLLN